jgi:hypothetical protein
MLGLRIEAALVFEVIALIEYRSDFPPDPVLHVSNLHASPHLLLGNPFEDSLFESVDVAADVQRFRLGRIRLPLVPERRYGPPSYRRWPSASTNRCERGNRCQR